MDGQRGRKGQKVALVPVERPESPSDLTPEQAEIWRATVNRLPADWFPAETHTLLRNYCRHAAEADWLDGQIAEAKATNAEPKDLDLLLKMRDREVKGMSTLATRMRVSQQSTYDATKSKGAKRGAVKPWERESG